MPWRTTSLSRLLGLGGTVTGEIFGLQNNATGPATEVLIDSYPASLGVISDLIATDWSAQIFNTFTETNGQISTEQFEARDMTSPLPLLTLQFGMGDLQTRDGEFTGPLTFAPVPEPFAWILLLTVMLAVAIVKRSRRRRLAA